MKIENDPFDYFNFSAGFREDASYEIRKSDSDINFGLSFPIKKYGFIDLSFIKGNTVNLTLTFGAAFNDKLVKKNKMIPKVINNKEKISFYEDLLANLNNNSILLQTASYETIKENKSLDIAIAVTDTNPIRSSSYSAFISSNVAKNHDVDLTSINVTHTMLGMETNKVSYIEKDINNLNRNTPLEVVIQRTKIAAGETNDFLNNSFKPEVSFPALFQTVSPNLVSHVGNPERFYFGGIVLQHESEIQFNRNLILSSNLKFTLLFSAEIASS